MKLDTIKLMFNMVDICNNLDIQIIHGWGEERGLETDDLNVATVKLVAHESEGQLQRK